MQIPNGPLKNPEKHSPVFGSLLGSVGGSDPVGACVWGGSDGTGVKIGGSGVTRGPLVSGGSDGVGVGGIGVGLGVSGG